MPGAHQSRTPQPEENTTESPTRPKEEKKPRGGKPVHTTPKPKKQNPISAAILSWFRESKPDLLSDSHNTDNQTLLVDKAPKRWVVYEPMVLLPSGSFTSAPWPEILNSSTSEQKSALWANILREISPTGALTHLAINEGIPLNVHGEASSQYRREGVEEENTLRSPSGLRLLHGEFGPALPANQQPTQEDFEKAFWVSTKQNGITQIWAPRYTMFSRGNIKEKARLLSDFPAASIISPSVTKSTARSKHLDQKREEGQDQNLNVQKRSPGAAERWAVDLYAGIGYFVFSYAKLGFRLLCWEINPWSVEGLRRGAVANGWEVVVLSPQVQATSNGTCRDETRDADASGRDEYDTKLVELVAGTGTHQSSNDNAARKRDTKDRPQIIVLLESNEFAERRIRRLREYSGSRNTTRDAQQSGGVLDVVHINCGFLPSSDKIWEDAWRIMVPSTQNQRHGVLENGVDGWLHLHENVGVRDIEVRKAEIQGLFDGWAVAVAVAASSSRTAPDSNEDRETGEVAPESARPKAEVVAKVEHVEMVKTFAPDVWHVVFDVHVTT